MNKLSHYKILADLFRYPDANFKENTDRFLNMLPSELPERHAELQQMVVQHQQLSLKQQEEYYLKTFDVQAVCYLDIGYVLFGEDYKRAQILVNLQAEHLKAGVDCGTELGDHLPNVLTLLSKTTDSDFADELGFIILLPAVRFMLTKFNKIGNHYYKTLLQVLFELLKRDFNGEGLQEYAPPEQAFSGKQEFVMTSPKSVICDTFCHKQKRF